MHKHPYDALMPTLNPRLTITLDPAVAASLRRLSEVTGNSQSKLIAELLEGSVPVFQRVIATIELAKSASAEIRGKLADDMGRAQTRVEQQLGLALGEFDIAAAPLLAEVEKVARRSRKRPVRPRNEGAEDASTSPLAHPLTPISNRGVRSTANPPKKAKQKEKTHGQV